jgi:TolA-binding protein
LQTDASLEQVSDNNTFVNNLSNRVNLLELANELTPTTSRIIELEKKIKELEIKIETLTAYNDTLISDRLQAVEIKMEMNYGA